MKFRPVSRRLNPVDQAHFYHPPATTEDLKERVSKIVDWCISPEITLAPIASIAVRNRLPAGGRRIRTLGPP
jgi:hypothetical protein